MCVKTAEHNTVSPNIYFFVKKSSMYKFTLLCFTTNVECLICQLLDDSIILSWVLHFSQDLYAEKKLVRLALSHTSVHVDFTEFSKMPDCHLRPPPHTVHQQLLKMCFGVGRAIQEREALGRKIMAFTFAEDS